MKLSTRRSTSKRTPPSSSSALLSSSTVKYDTENVSHSSLFSGEVKRLHEINITDFIRGDTRLPERYVFDTDLFPDYTRSTQRRLVDVIQAVCEAQQSPISVHQWANEEHDDRIVRRIRFRCAYFRKKKRFTDKKGCGFQFQVCYQAKHGWCLLNGKGHAAHEGHELPAPKVAPALLKKNGKNNHNNHKSNDNNHRKPAAKASRKTKSPTASVAAAAAPKKKLNNSPATFKCSKAAAAPACVSCCASTTCSSTTEESSIMTAGWSPQHYFPNFPDENDIVAQNAAWKDLKETSDCKVGYSLLSSSSCCFETEQRGEKEIYSQSTNHFNHHSPGKLFYQIAPAYIDFALDPIHNMPTGDEDEMMNWDLLDEEEPLVTTSVPESGAGGLLHKTIHLSETPFPEVTDLEAKVAGIMEALRNYASAHNFVVTVEDHDTVDKPGEKTLRVVLHCLGSDCCYQVALLWVVGLTRWNIYCQPDGIFVHGCSRLEKQGGAACACAATPVNQALDHLDDFLNGEVVCPDEGGSDIPTVVAAAKWGQEKKVSDNVRKETRKAVAKVAGVDATASAA